MTLLTCVFVFAGCVWLGGLVAIAVVARVAGGTLPAARRVAFFRALGRAYGVVGGLALAVTLAAGGVLLAGDPWGGLRISVTAVAAALVVITLVGVAQARRMTRLRSRALTIPEDHAVADQVTGGGRRAFALRGAIALLSLTLMVEAVLLAR